MAETTRSLQVVVCLALLLACFHGACGAEARPEISLAGQWRFAIDRNDGGVDQRWFNKTLPEVIRLPGAMAKSGFGDTPSAETRWTAGLGANVLKEERFQPYLYGKEFRTPFWLVPQRYYAGAAWYQKQVNIPEKWRDKRIVLYLERPHWETAVWVDDKKAGTCNSLGTAHEHDLTALLTPGPHRLTVRADNRVKIPVGNDAHSVSDQTQGNWNGITGQIKLTATEKIWLDNIQLYPNARQRSVRVSVEIGNRTGTVGHGSLTVSARSCNSPGAHRVSARTVPVQWTEKGARAELTYELGPQARLWDEFSPALYQLVVSLRSDSGERVDDKSITFGLREVGVSGTQFTLNGRPVFLRGTLECCIFPQTGYPPTDVDAWKRIITVAKAYGLNHLRFHSWCPPEAAFQAADEMGFYYQVECSCWTRFGDGSPVDEWVYQESERMVRAYGNHPSFLLMAPSNEPGGKNRDRFLGDWVKHWRSIDPRRKYTAGSGWPMIAENDYHVTYLPRMSATNKLNQPPETASDYRDFISEQNAPVVSHEIGQWCVYPDFDEMAQYTGYLKPGNLEIFQDMLKRSGMADQARDFLMASGRFQALLYKEEIESALRTPGMAGFQLLDLHDFPGQGTAVVGVVNAFWNDKGYITAGQYRRFCSQTVPLARMKRLIVTHDRDFEAEIELAHYGSRNLKGAKAAWRITDSVNAVIAKGSFGPMDVPTGSVTSMGRVTLSLTRFVRAAQLNLEVAVEGTDFVNDWDFWVYPAKVDAAIPATMTLTKELNERTGDVLNRGGTVLLVPPRNRLAGKTTGTFRPIFWNRVMFSSQKEHTVGILCDPNHPMFADFPTGVHSDWQWWDLQQNCRPMVLDALPADIRPVVQMIDDWSQCRKLGLVLEARVNKGRLVVCSVDIETDLDRRPVARQFRKSLFDYMAGEQFRPSARLETAQLQTLFREPSLMEKLGAGIIHADSAAPGHEADKIIDGDPQTIWHTPWGSGAAGFPHEVVIGFDESVVLTGLLVTPRQDMSNGWIKDYAVYAGSSNRDWGDPVVRGSFAADAAVKEVNFPNAVTCRYLRLVAISSFRDAPYASLAEIELKTGPGSGLPQP